MSFENQKESSSSLERKVAHHQVDKILQSRKAKELEILYDVYDLKPHSKIKSNNQYFTVSELLDLNWTIEQIVKQKYIE